MKPLVTLALLASLVTAEETALFNGKDLTGWAGNPKFWSVEDGAITGTTTPENPTKANGFIIWKGGEPGDFTLILKYKMIPGDANRYTNSGVQYRSKVIDAEAFVVGGYQADIEYSDTYSGILYEEQGRGILAARGEQVLITQGENPGKPNLEITGKTGDPKIIQDAINKDGWNEYKIIAAGENVKHFINGHLTADVTDKTAEAPKAGVIALQIHAGAPMKIQFKDLILTTK